MAKKSDKSTVDERQQTYLELYFLAKLGFEVFTTYFHTERLNKKFKEKLERLYVLMWNEYQSIIKTYPKAKQEAVVFEHYDNLPGVNWEIAQDWLIGGPLDPEGGGPIIGAEDYHKDALGRIQGWYYTVGGRDMELAKTSKIWSLCEEAQEALELSKAVQKLNDNFIPEYTLDWNNISYEITVNGVYHLATTRDGSASTKIMTEVMKYKGDNGKTAFTVNLGATKRPLWQVLNSDLHIDPLLRQIFFKGSGSDKLCFRSAVTKQQLLDEGIDTSDLDVKLIASGAKFKKKSQLKPKN